MLGVIINNMITKHFLKIVFILIFVFLFSPFLKVSASELCSSNGYTVLFVDNTFTNEDGAVIVKNRLSSKLPETLNGQKIIIDYLYSPKSDYIKMLDDMSKKVATQKLLLVAFQQDNLSVNNFYNKIASQSGGIPKESVSVYSMDASTTRNNIIVSLDKLKNNDEQENEELCIDPPEFSIFYKIKSALSAYADFIIDNAKKAVVYIANSMHSIAVAIGNSIHNAGLAIGNVFTNLSANIVKSLPESGNIGTTFPSINISELVKPAWPVGRDGPSQKRPSQKNKMTAVIAPAESIAVPIEKENTANDILLPVAPVVVAPIAPAVSNVVHHHSGGGGGSPAKDTTPPVITILGNNPETITLGSSYTDAGATASDNVDGDITSNIIVVNPVNTSIVGAYIITYNVSDAAGNLATEVTRTVNVNAPPIPLSSAKIITAFNFASLNPEVIGTIDENNHTVSLTVPFGTDVTALTPAIVISDKASINPNTNVVQNFTNPITYTVTAEDSSTQDYIATVLIAPDPNPVILPSITGYTFNGNAGDITINPSATSPLSLVLTANENVDWVSIRIENQNDMDIYKIFYSGTGCVDGTDTCTKTWDGSLSKGGPLQNGIYQVIVRIRDLADDKIDYDFTSPYIINVDTLI